MAPKWAESERGEIAGYFVDGEWLAKVVDEKDNPEWREPTADDLYESDRVVVGIPDSENQMHYYTVVGGINEDFDLDYVIDYLIEEYGDEIA